MFEAWFFFTCCFITLVAINLAVKNVNNGKRWNGEPTVQGWLILFKYVVIMWYLLLIFWNSDKIILMSLSPTDIYTCYFLTLDGITKEITTPNHGHRWKGWPYVQCWWLLLKKVVICLYLLVIL